MFFINQTQGIEHGFQFGNADDQLSDPFSIDKLKSVGKILLKWHKGSQIKNYETNKNYHNYINMMLLQESIKANRFNIVFQNAKRSTSGKFSKPYTPDHILQLLVASA